MEHAVEELSLPRSPLQLPPLILGEAAPNTIILPG